MDVLIKRVFGGLIILIAALLLALQCFNWYSARKLPGELPGPRREYPEATRALMWRQLGGNGEVSVRKLNVVSYLALSAELTVGYLLNPNAELKDPTDLHLLNMASSDVESRIAEQSRPAPSPETHDASQGTSAESLQQLSFATHSEGIALRIRLSREWPATRMLDMVLDHGDYRRGTSGLDHAAMVYFGVPVERLTPAETVALLTIDLSAGDHDPYCDADAFVERYTQFLVESGVVAAEADPMRHLTRLKPIACE